MSDLISRSAFIELLKANTMSNGTLINTNTMLALVEKMPTAYDPEKVVAEMEKEKEIHTEHYNASLYKDFPDVKRRYEQTCMVIDKNIEIVRKGGV